MLKGEVVCCSPLSLILLKLANVDFHRNVAIVPLGEGNEGTPTFCS